MGIALPRRIGLALGGGVLRGLAHIGVLEVIDDLGIEVESIAGTSSGAAVGALYAAGVAPRKISQIARHAQWRDLAEISIRRDGLIGTKRLAAYLDSFIEGKTFQDLRIGFATVACDVASGSEVVITDGNVSEAVRASCSIPGIFVPVKTGGRMLVDGGVCNNVPVSVVRALGAKYVVAVDVNTAAIGSGSNPANVFQVIVQAIEILQRGNVEHEIRHADMVLRPDLSNLNPVDFDNAPEFVERGREAAWRAFRQAASPASVQNTGPV